MGDFKIYSSQPAGPPYFLYIECYWSKNYTCIKNVHGIYFIKYINSFRKMLRSSEYTTVLNTSGFWIYQGHEYASGSEYATVLNKPGFWISQGLEYTTVLNTRLVLNLPGFWIRVWFWICQGSEYVRVKQGSEHACICMIMSGWICLDMSEYAGICVNMPKSARMAFPLYFPHCNTLFTWRRGYFFNVYTKLEVLVWMRTRLFP